jgi:hypothetical protein
LERHVDSTVVIVSSAKLGFRRSELHGRRRSSSGVGFLRAVEVQVQAEHAVVVGLSLHEWRVDASSNQGAGASCRVIADDRSGS